MLIDLPNRIANLRLPKSRPLLPLFEALSNSIDAIEEARIKGRIDISIEREKQQKSLSAEVLATEPITGFRVDDNGIGFTEANYESFCTSDSSKKQSSGGKGIGRLSWLATFNHADIESIFKSDKGYEVRKFRFECTKEGVTAHKRKKVDAASRRTTVKLVHSNRAFRDYCPKTANAIALKIIEHFLELFERDKCPDIYLHDECEEALIHINQVFKSERFEEVEKKYRLKQHAFTIRHVRLSSKIASGHMLHFCARGRSVVSEDATKSVSNLKPSRLDDLNDDGQQFFYAAYVSSPHLEERLVSDRNSFEIPFADSILEGEDEVSWEAIVKEASRKASSFLARYTAPERKAKFEWVEDYARRHPKYRPLIKHKPEWVDTVTPGISDEELDLELYRLNQKYDLELKQRGKKLESAVKGKGDLASHRKKLDHFLEEWNQAGKALLCDYVVHRRATLDFLEDCLKRSVEGETALEDIIHDTIFPMRATSDDFAADASNLWVVDERLAFHYYLASDKLLQSVDPIEVAASNGKQRSDLLVFQRFDNPTAIVESQQPFDSITVIEFKRPGRDDYTASKNPIDQVDKYIDDIQSGTVKDRDGKLIKPRTGTPYYAFIICSITPTLESIAKRRGFIPTPDGQGYMKMHPTLYAYQEIISYDKLLSDAKKRNRAFFEKMGIAVT